ncbi:hypothetical protein OE88DRAFT_1643653 [Heliocybe sulcata]|uniref:Uncharacterized protein n=1 Tax=Heliocybe sulcata TaxID=5364 RepID=A0A5C3N7Y4_9AGAM|nr:hypothetical protein OE88DRAFT_1643653 [Heliocybe sulcata]
MPTVPLILSRQRVASPSPSHHSFTVVRPGCLPQRQDTPSSISFRGGRMRQSSFYCCRQARLRAPGRSTRYLVAKSAAGKMELVVGWELASRVGTVDIRGEHGLYDLRSPLHQDRPPRWPGYPTVFQCCVMLIPFTLSIVLPSRTHTIPQPQGLALDVCLKAVFTALRPGIAPSHWTRHAGKMEVVVGWELASQYLHMAYANLSRVGPLIHFPFASRLPGTPRPLKKASEQRWFIEFRFAHSIMPAANTESLCQCRHCLAKSPNGVYMLNPALKAHRAAVHAMDAPGKATHDGDDMDPESTELFALGFMDTGPDPAAGADRLWASREDYQAELRHHQSYEPAGNEGFRAPAKVAIDQSGASEANHAGIAISKKDLSEGHSPSRRADLINFASA